jgi:hypothetical protein
MNRKYPSEITEIRVDAATFKNTGTVISLPISTTFSETTARENPLLPKQSNLELASSILQEDLPQTTRYWFSTKNISIEYAELP